MLLAWVRGVTLIWTRSDPLVFDGGGHLASAMTFWRVGWHGFQDQSFSGGIHGLFYPPLEDLVLGMFEFVGKGVFGIEVETVYRGYLSMLFGVFLYTAIKVADGLHDGRARRFYVLALLFVSGCLGLGTLPFQGLSLPDLIHTGLSSEFLSVSFFFLGIRALLRDSASVTRMMVLGSLIVLSHVVVGATFLGLLSLMAILGPNRKKWIGVIIGILGLTAASWLPAFAHREFLARNTIVGFQPQAILIAGLSILLGYKARANRMILGFSVGAALMLLVGAWDLGLPLFHYYRFAILGVYLFLISLGASKRIISSRLWNSVAASFLIISILSNGARSLPPVAHGDPAKAESDFVAPPEFREYGRYWVVGNRRMIDFGLESLLSMTDPNFRSSKGLFWESSSDHTLLSSYMASLARPPTILNFAFLHSYSCEVQKCILDSYFETYNIRGIIGDLPSSPSYLRPSQEECYSKIFGSNLGTERYSFRETSRLRVHGREVPVYEIVPRIPRSGSYLAAIERIAPDRIESIEGRESGKLSLEERVLGRISVSCQKAPIGRYENVVWVSPKDHRVMASVGSQGPDPEFAATGDGRYQLRLAGAQADWYWVKLSAQPGMEFRNEAGDLVPHVDAFPHTLIHGKGLLTLELRRTPAMKWGYVISLISIGTLFCFFGILRFRKRALTQLGSFNSKPELK